MVVGACGNPFLLASNFLSEIQGKYLAEREPGDDGVEGLRRKNETVI